MNPKNYSLSALSEKAPEFVEALGSLKKTGMIRVSLPEEITDIFPDILSLISLSEFDRTQIEAGYSCPVAIPEQIESRLTNFGNFLAQSSVARRYLFSPNLVGVHTTLSIFDQRAVEKPTHAHLWHRDRDDEGRQLKLFLPVTPCGPENGMFSALSSSCVSFNNYLWDKKLIKVCESSNDNYRASDRVRLTDAVIRDRFKAQIFDFRASPGEALLVDTNLCYHKGGLILKDGAYRLMIQLTIGSFTHSWRKKDELDGLRRKSLLHVRNKLNKVVRAFTKERDIFL